jgi:hypothetical protein
VWTAHVQMRIYEVIHHWFIYKEKEGRNARKRKHKLPCFSSKCTNIFVLLDISESQYGLEEY